MGVWERETGMGWFRLVVSSKLQVSFAAYRLFYRALLQKRPKILRSLLVEAPPYTDRVRVCVEVSFLFSPALPHNKLSKLIEVSLWKISVIFSFITPCKRDLYQF